MQPLILLPVWRNIERKQIIIKKKYPQYLYRSRKFHKEYIQDLSAEH